MVIFNVVRWKNLYSTGNDFTEIDFTILGTKLIVGNNGSGKSTLLCAITFGLYGKPFRNVNKAQMVNSITKKNLVVEIEFSIGSNLYKIIRGAVPNIFEIYLNGSMMAQTATMADYQEMLEKNILKINYKTFCQVVILGSASFVPFMQLKAVDKRNIIEELLDLQIFTNMNNVLKEMIGGNLKEITDVENSKRNITEKIILVKEHLEEVTNKNIELVKKKQETINELMNKIDEKKIIVASVVDEAKNLEKDIKEETKLNNRLDQLKDIRANINVKKSAINKEIVFFSNNVNCPVCKQEIDEKFKCDNVGHKTEEIKELETALIDLNVKYSDTENKIKSVVEIKNKISVLRTEWLTHDAHIKNWKQQIVSLQQDIDSANDVKQNNNEIKIVDLENDLTELRKNGKMLSDTKDVYTATALMLKDGGIKAKLINQYISIINKLINKYLEALEFYVQLELNDKFEETIKSRFRDDFSYESFSEGEKNRIDIAILFCFRDIAKLRNSASTNLLILDEIFDSSLDSNSVENLMTILNTTSKNTSIYVISHNTDQISDKFKNVYKFKKVKNFSTMEIAQ